MSGDLLSQAAAGSRDAQAAMLDAALAELATQDDTTLPQDLGALETWGRIAAAHGYPADGRRLAAVLMLRGAYERAHGSAVLADTIDAEALWLLDVAADAGDEQAAKSLGQAAELVPASAFDRLRAMKAAAEPVSVDPVATAQAMANEAVASGTLADCTALGADFLQFIGSAGPDLSADDAETIGQLGVVLLDTAADAGEQRARLVMALFPGEIARLRGETPPAVTGNC